MPETNETIIIDRKLQVVADFGKCIMCGGALKPEAPGSTLMRCPVCGCVQKLPVTIAPGYLIGGRYRILNQLGSGGSGSLFFCHPLDDPQKRFVLKVLKSAAGSHRKRFEREARILASIQDEPRIARILDFGEDGDNSFIVMEYIDGRNLRQLRDEYCMNEETSLQIVREVVHVLQHLWEKYSIIHRDIKPENIMLDREFRVKLLDFGISKRFSAGQESTITMEMSGLGTPGYLSPEQFVDSRNVDFRSDIFSLGATLCFLMTGEKPFAGSDTAEIYHNTLKNSPPQKLDFDTECSPGCRALIDRMMQRQPEDRFVSYAELASAVDVLLQ